MVSARVRPGNGEGAQDQVQAEGVRPLDVEASTTAPDEDADGVGVVVAPDGVAVVAIEPGPLEDLERRLRQVSSAYVQLQGEMQSLRERSDRLQEERDRRRRHREQQSFPHLTVQILQKSQSLFQNFLFS